jgi:hypothetical protein
MAISSFSAASSGAVGGTNNFVLKTTAETTYVLDRTYTSGRYSLSFLDSDSTFDIYAIAEDGTYAGYTASTILEVSADFAEIVVLGAASGTRINFTHLGTLTEALTSGDVATAGAFISSVVTSSLPSIDDTTVLNGGNFAANVEVSFIDQSAVETAAKTVVRSSSTQLIITRPDAFLPSDSPFTVKVVNPGIPVPASTNAHLLSNSVTAGTNPVWTTGTTIIYNVGGATSVTLLATDTEASDIDYSVVSGTLPAGLTLDGETGVISGTFSGSASEGDVTAVTIRAIDTGGNFLDKAFSLTANTVPAWTTSTNGVEPPTATLPYSFQLVSSTGTLGGTLTYSLQSGALLPGHSLSSAGVISGTSTGVADDTATFTVRVTDELGLFADRAFTVVISPLVATISGGTLTSDSTYNYYTFTSSGSLLVENAEVTLDYLVVAGGGGTEGSYPTGGGGGAGGLLAASSTITPNSYAVIVGSGGAGGASAYAGVNGNDSSWNSIVSTGGGNGGSQDFAGSINGSSGGSGGGPSALRRDNQENNPFGIPGTGIPGQGNDGGNPRNTGNTPQSPMSDNAGGGGGGALSAGSSFSGGDGRSDFSSWAAITGTGDSGAYAGGGGGSSPTGPDGSGGIGGGGDANSSGQINTGGGAGGNANNGGSGIIIFRVNKELVA